MTDPNPYRPPRAPMLSTPAVRPAVWTWYVVYCVFMAVVYLAVIALGALLAVVPLGEGEMDGMAGVYVTIFIALGVVLFLPYVAAPFLPKRPWTWVLGVALIGIGLTSCLTLPACIPLLIYWLKPETQLLFGKSPEKLT